jgi:hypothetical protein
MVYRFGLVPRALQQEPESFSNIGLIVAHQYVHGCLKGMRGAKSKARIFSNIGCGGCSEMGRSV